MGRRLPITLAAAVVAAAAVALGGALRGGSGEPVAVAPAAAADSVQSGFAPGDTRALVRELETKARQRPDAKTWGLLGLAYLQRARETGRAELYPRAERALRQALRIAPRDLTATQGLGSLALTRHRFHDALVLGRRAVALSPSTARSYGIVGDALLELGRYRAAVRTFNRMVALKPSVSSYARVSYAAELLGDVAGARAAMQLARDAASGRAEPIAWTEWQLAKLALNHGDLTASERHLRRSLQALPGYYNALDLYADVEAARGRIGRAVELARLAAARVRDPHTLVGLGDMYARAGDDAKAQEQYALVRALTRRAAAQGARTELEAAQFEADHGRPGVALVLARRALASRPSIDAEDALAWALGQNGRCAEGLVHSHRALRLGTLDAVKLFHRAELEACAGNRRTAREWHARASGVSAPIVRLLGNTPAAAE